MKTVLCKVTYNGVGMDRPCSIYFRDWYDAQKFLSEQECGEIDVITLEHNEKLNIIWDGCSWGELTYGCENVPKDVTKYRRVYMDDGNFRDESYEYYCHKLGIDPDVHFVEITNRGTITFTCGKPDEVKYLLKKCRECGYKPAKSLVDAAR